MKILWDQPNALQGAVATETNEQNFRATIQMSHQRQVSNNNHTPIEVDNSRGQKFKFKNRVNRINSSVNTEQVDK